MDNSWGVCDWLPRKDVHIRPSFFSPMWRIEMENPVMDDPVWSNAMSLCERAVSLRAACSSAPAAAVSTHSSDQELAEKRIHRWRSMPPFDNQGRFDRRLAADMLDECQLRSLLGEPVE